jgi:Aldehyde dehydrogenase family
LPAYDRLYTIIGLLKRGMIHICLRPRTIADPRHRREAEIQPPGGHAGMNAPVPRILIESMWRGRLFGAQWRPAIGGSLDVLEPATGAVITRVGNATAEDVRQAAAEARAAQPGWAATP